MNAKRSGVLGLLLALIIGSAGCGGAQRARSGGTAWYEIRFKGAALSSRRASGVPWHTSGSDQSASLIGGLIGLAVGYPEVGFALGSALTSEPEPEAPAPYVVLKVGGDTYQLSPIGQTLAPRWSQPIAVPSGRYASKTPALIQILDAVDGGILGQRTTTVGELLAPGPRTLTEIGDVASLDVEARAMEPRPVVSVELFVDAQRSVDELKGGADPRWTAIPIWNGDTVTIRATGEVCPSEPTPCFGPAGAEPGRWAKYNYDAFATSRHASLVAVLPGQAIAVGDERTFVAEQAGFLILFVNDTDEGNNAGGFDVRVDIAPR